MGNAESGGDHGDFGGGGGRGPGDWVDRQTADRTGFTTCGGDRGGIVINTGNDGFTISGAPAGTTASFDRDGNARINVGSDDRVKHLVADKARERTVTNFQYLGVAIGYQEYNGHGTLGISTHDTGKFAQETVRDPPTITSITVEHK